MMTEQVYTLSTLFEQLGLSGESTDMDAFIASHPLPEDTPLSEADFWTPAQARFLCEGILRDANWAEAIDELNLRLHQ
ncbi:MAG: DUF2789 domain-containing protein [Thiothrix sp.]|nr:DUF2789 domain-containing protein [Thiothrix sp.]HPQ96476.1 DUF2789 domain-containing protein [Thiolinea sp.]